MPSHDDTAHAGLNQKIARAVVRCRKRYLGHGPTDAQAFYHHNIVVVMMRETLLEAERSLVEAGQADSVLQMRLRYQQTMRPALIAMIEDLTTCKVVAAMSSSHISPHLAAELFVLDRPVPGARGEHREA